MRAALVLALGLELAAGAVRADAPQTSPRPQAAPRLATVPGPTNAGLALLSSARPSTKPGKLKLAAMSGASVPAKVGKPGARGAVCGVAGITGVSIPPIPSKVSGCGLEDGVKVTAVSGIPLSIPATAKALKTWVDKGIVPAVGNRGGGVARLELAGSYTCRARNNQKGSKASEHGRGRAIDLKGIRLANGKVITVLDGWKSEAKLLKAVHRSACGTFGTVLGPKSDRFHQDHIHVDTARHQNGAYCR
ncbi:extensin family protein [Sinirhodobacter sp. WL0062]|uniref:Extensin family protein n=1 Tax=Rhodobacter flavimaris TaxID=2907145 RepID=A0ABS8Z5D9_9RHOB|nr:extensin family protein [Sinirhodobacter sp. WL0062]MCE5975155.1 extensin family protein [Sinirhodobacter sp. WL0062]